MKKTITLLMAAVTLAVCLMVPLTASAACSSGCNVTTLKFVKKNDGKYMYHACRDCGKRMSSDYKMAQ